MRRPIAGMACTTAPNAFFAHVIHILHAPPPVVIPSAVVPLIRALRIQMHDSNGLRNCQGLCDKAEQAEAAAPLLVAALNDASIQHKSLGVNLVSNRIWC